MKPIKVLLLGAGSRGAHTYASYAARNPRMMAIAAVAEPDPVKRAAIAAAHGISESRAFGNWEEALAAELGVDAVIIATQDRMHLGPLAAAMERRLHILCEKPIAPTFAECAEIELKAMGFNRVFAIAHVLRHTSFFARIRQLVASGRIGRLAGIDLTEHVGHVHMSHSYVRGNWRKESESSPMILAKSCHDMDILRWLAGADCESLGSYGDLLHFRAENAPEGAPERCLDGCPAAASCPYHAQKIYLTERTDWPTNVISTDLSLAARTAALETGPWGRCVYRCDNDVVDHQVVSLRFVNGVAATFTMTAFSQKTHRSIKLFGTAGEIAGDMEEGRIEVGDFSTGERETIALDASAGGHAGGDDNLIGDFVRSVSDGAGGGEAGVREALQSHFMAFAAERSRSAGGIPVRIGRREA
jgi:predicted dehydrogenase